MRATKILTCEKKYESIKASAHGKRAFTLSLAQYRKMWQKPCAYCGDPTITTGLDRIDSDLGYVPGNVAPCCWTCNIMKRNLPLDDWLAHIKKIYLNTSERDK